MRRSKFSEEQVIGILKEHEAGLTAAEICRKYAISDAELLQVAEPLWRHGGVGRSPVEGS